MKIILLHFTRLALLLLVSQVCFGQTYVQLNPAASQTVIQPVVGATRSTLGVNSINNTYYVNQWCSTAGVLDDTCFRNAVNDIVANGPVDDVSPNKRMQVLIVPPGIYTINSTVSIPYGINISIKGSYQAGIYGSVIRSGPCLGEPSSTCSGSTSTVFFAVSADNVSIEHVAFVDTIAKHAGIATTAITLGSTTQATYDTHINWCWFAGENAAIHIVNGGGYDLSHNTFDAGTNYGIFSDAATGDLAANDIIADDLRGYGQISTIAIIGPSTQTPNYEGYKFSGIFDHSISGSSAISLTQVTNATISGIFNNNNYQDININGSSGVVISDFQVYDPGQSSVVVANSSGVQIVNGTIYNSNTKTAGTPMISVTASGNTTVSNITSLNAGTANASVGLFVDSTTRASVIYGNNFNAQTGAAYSVFDPTAGMTVQGTLNASRVVPANGFTGTKTAGQCVLTISSGIITNVSGC